MNIASLRRRVDRLAAAARMTVEELLSWPRSRLTPEELRRIVEHLESKVERLGGVERLDTVELEWLLAHERGDDQNCYTGDDIESLCEEYGLDPEEIWEGCE